MLRGSWCAGAASRFAGLVQFFPRCWPGRQRTQARNQSHGPWQPEPPVPGDSYVKEKGAAPPRREQKFQAKFAQKVL
ncbi:uncharacterized protein LOC141565022 isoform X3 [Sminthopsis crassicaudata]|uniref:uncharacterized protein LOC141565022 isoform X3 n=1 Tax=Sminthopsis crassicaudata TaxID=9301 RepID=UPI003D69DE24